MLPPDQQPDGDRQQRVPGPGAGEVARSSSRRRSRVSTITAAVALAKRPKAMPEFWTWWIVKRPDHLHLVVERQLARDDVLRQLVGDEGGAARPLPG